MNNGIEGRDEQQQRRPGPCASFVTTARAVAETVGKTLDEIRAKHPDVSIEMVDDSGCFTYGNYEAAIHTLIEGAVLAVIVVMLFLRNWRATLISAVALPLSAIPTFWVMELLGFSLNLVSFLAMTLATGILVDDAIVEIENIERHIRMGKSPYRAAIEAADEIGLAVIAIGFVINSLRQDAIADAKRKADEASTTLRSV
jgi:multidrug efflux pump subunit AcrB